MTKGFTGVELLITVAILVALALLAAPPFLSFRDTQVLNATASEVVALMNEARGSATASKESSAYGVHLEAGRAVYFKGDTFVESSPGNKEVVFDTAARISAIALQGGAVNVVFDQLTGQTSAYGSVTFEASGNPDKRKVVTVLPSGVVTYR